MKESLDTQIKRMITKYPYDIDLKNAIDLVQERVSTYCYWKIGFIGFSRVGFQFLFFFLRTAQAYTVYYFKC